MSRALCKVNVVACPGLPRAWTIDTIAPQVSIFDNQKEKGFC